MVKGMFGGQPSGKKGQRRGNWARSNEGNDRETRKRKGHVMVVERVA